MPRYSLYEGVKGRLCPHPAAELASRRHPGMKRVPLAEGEVLGNLCDLYEPIQEVHEAHRCLDKAVKSGHLTKLDGPIVAKNHTEAIAKLLKPAPVAKHKTTKGDS